ncbi:MAG: hypothetical protein A2145_02620 [candidate division Zixibacteria bacterium RBG_16_40_9]|nr:MAG: hypothetical protein A2145_02620 [candidate division Zixibacteria bacterium RBG_16_40_9]
MGSFRLIGRGVLLGVITPFFMFSCSKENYLGKFEEGMEQVLEKVSPSIVAIMVKDGEGNTKKVGSGVVISDNMILTTQSCVGDIDENLTIKLQNGKELYPEQIDLICSDYETNICFIKLKTSGLPKVEFAQNEKIKAGALGIAVGNCPYSKGVKVNWGILGRSWIGGEDPYDEALLILDAKLGPEAGGTPVFNNSGQLIGIVEGKIEGEDNLALILPASTCQKVHQALEKEGYIDRGWIGIYVDLGGGAEEEEQMLIVSQTPSPGPAFKSGVHAGDIIVRLNGKKIPHPLEFRKLVSMSQPGSKIHLTLNRDGHLLEKELSIEPAPRLIGLRRCSNRSI